MKLKEEAVDYRDGDTELSGLLVWDDRELAGPGILVVHGGAGPDDHATGRARQRALAGIKVLASDPRVNGSIAAVGYCFGGRTVLEVARTGADLAGVISVHGS